MTSPMFSAEEMVFLRSLLDMPEDRNTWLVYADWLEDRSDPRAEFLRLVVARSLMAEDDPMRQETEARLAQLRIELNPQWMMMFDPALVGNCYSCRWDELNATDLPDIRLCSNCRRAVIYCHTIEEAREYASCEQLVALSTRIPLEVIAQDLAFQRFFPSAASDSDVDFELELPPSDLDGDFEMELPPPPPRPWWKFW